jgi:hypothetical protein
MAPYIDRYVSRRRKRSKSVREDDATLDIQRQVLLRYSIHLRVIDVCHGKDGNLNASRRYMDKLHIFQPSQLYQVVSAQV